MGSSTNNEHLRIFSLHQIPSFKYKWNVNDFLFSWKSQNLIGPLDDFGHFWIIFGQILVNFWHFWTENFKALAHASRKAYIICRSDTYLVPLPHRVWKYRTLEDILTWYLQTWEKLKLFHRQILGGLKFPQNSVIPNHLKIIISIVIT